MAGESEGRGADRRIRMAEQDGVREVDRAGYCEQGLRRKLLGAKEKLRDLGLHAQRALKDVPDYASGVRALVDTGEAPCSSKLGR